MNRRLPPGQAQRQASPQQPWTHGALDRVPCPHCGKPNDLRELHSEQLLDTGHEIDCGHCGRLMEVARMATVVIVAVRPLQGRSGGIRRGSAAPATTISHSQLQKLLR